MYNRYSINEGYQKKDERVVDYKLAHVDNYPIPFRGPIPAKNNLDSGLYFSVVGAAQTFGRFAQFPYAQIFSSAIDIPCLNLGMAGAGPQDFEINDFLIDLINGGRFCVVQIMSARSVENSAAFCPFGGLLSLRDSQDCSVRPAQEVWEEILRTRTPSEAMRLVDETLTNYVEAMRSLLARISVPVVLLWFSRRRSTQLKKIEMMNSAKNLLGSFPHLVTEKMFLEIAQCADHVCESASSFGLPQTLRDYRGARGLVPVYPQNPVPHENGYYPSQEMHAHCAMQLMRLVHSTADFPGTRCPRPSVNCKGSDRSAAYQRFVDTVAEELPLKKALAAGSFAVYARDAVLRGKLETLSPDVAVYSRSELAVLRESSSVLIVDPDEERVANQLEALRPPNSVVRFADDAFPALATQRRIDGISAAPFKRHFAVLCTPRSGSTYLCDLLAINGVGKPREHIRRAARYFRSSGRDPLRALDRIIFFDNGGETFGTKLISDFLIESGLLDDVAAFERYVKRKNFKFVRLHRNNADQAVSSYLAEALNIWHARSEAEVAEIRARRDAIKYDFAKIYKLYSEIVKEDQILSSIVSKMSLPCFEVEYSAICNRPREVLMEIADYIGAPANNITLDSAKVVRSLDDQVTQHFRERFARDLTAWSGQ